MYRSAHSDQFARDNLPDAAMQPEFVFSLPELRYPERLNCAVEFIDRHVAAGRGGAVSLRGIDGASWTYAELAAQVNRIANVLVGPLGLVPGNRVLLRAANTPMMVAIYFAVLKAGGIVVATMPLLRARELAAIAEKAQIRLAFCDARLIEEMEKTRAQVPALARIVTFQSPDAPAELEALLRDASPEFAACDTAQDDACLISFTSGTTGTPKGTIHYHRDLLAICDTFSKQVLRPEPDDVFIGSPPLAFTFGLGGLVLFPFRIGAAALLLEKASPPDLLAAIQQGKATILFTAPTAFRAMLARLGEFDISSLRKCVSAGETLPKATWESWKAATGLAIIDGLGSTEMLHIFIAASGDEIRPGATGKPIPGYEAKVIGPAGETLPPGQVGRLAVRGPTGCRYLADARQAAYVQDGWNLTGDVYLMDEEGYFWYQARSDDMIISSGYNIAGPEVEGALLTHPLVMECCVVGVPDADRGQIIKAYVVLKPAASPNAETIKALQKHVQAEIAPYKYPRQVEFVSELPRTETGKLRRHVLRDRTA